MMPFKSKNHIYIFILLVLLLTTFTKPSLIWDIRLSLDCIFSGILALTGFVFTARTFITFKLNEVIYGTPYYREYVEKLKKEGAYNKELYDPLKKMDSDLGQVTHMCLVSLAFFSALAFMPKENTIAPLNSQAIEMVLDLYKYYWGNLLNLNKVIYPFLRKVFSDVALLYFVYNLYYIFITAKSLNKNIQTIIQYWDEEYKKIKKQP